MHSVRDVSASLSCCASAARTCSASVAVAARQRAFAEPVQSSSAMIAAACSSSDWCEAPSRVVLIADIARRHVSLAAAGRVGHTRSRGIGTGFAGAIGELELSAPRALLECRTPTSTVHKSPSPVLTPPFSRHGNPNVRSRAVERAASPAVAVGDSSAIEPQGRPGDAVSRSGV